MRIRVNASASTTPVKQSVLFWSQKHLYFYQKTCVLSAEYASDIPENAAFQPEKSGI